MEILNNIKNNYLQMRQGKHEPLSTLESLAEIRKEYKYLECQIFNDDTAYQDIKVKAAKLAATAIRLGEYAENAQGNIKKRSKELCEFCVWNDAPGEMPVCIFPGASSPSSSPHSGCEKYEYYEK